jgi:hypothetical protein
LNTAFGEKGRLVVKVENPERYYTYLYDGEKLDPNSPYFYWDDFVQEGISFYPDDIYKSYRIFANGAMTANRATARVAPTMGNRIGTYKSLVIFIFLLEEKLPCTFSPLRRSRFRHQNGSVNQDINGINRFGNLSINCVM